MIRQVIFRPLALKDIFEAVNWYENQRLGLGEALVEEISKAIRVAQNNPKQFRIVRQKDGLRVANTKRFPYRVFFTNTVDSIFVHAVQHGARDEQHWMNR